MEPLVLIIIVIVSIHLARKVIAQNRALREQEEEQKQYDEEIRERQKEQELARINAHKIQQQHYHTTLVDLASDAFALFESMPKHLMSTEELLDQAESDFEEGAFAPFWDSVESAAMQLGRFDDNVRTITIKADSHTQYAKSYEAIPPPFPIILDTVNGMAAAKNTNDRMRAIVRKAQCNFQFATIFEQRKTNQLLVAGFTNLAQALDGMGRRIESSINYLGRQISQMSSTLDESLQNLGSNLNETLTTLHKHSMETVGRMANNVEGIHSSIQKDAGDRAERHKQALAMLDNIQRRRRPYPTGLRDGEY